jgi:hypothetical protein
VIREDALPFCNTTFRRQPMLVLIYFRRIGDAERLHRGVQVNVAVRLVNTNHGAGVRQMRQVADLHLGKVYRYEARTGRSYEGRPDAGAEVGTDWYLLEVRPAGR